MPSVYCRLFRKLVLGKSYLFVHYDTYTKCRTKGLKNWLPVPTYVSLIGRVEKQRSFFNRLTFLSRECFSKGLFSEQNTFAIYSSIRRSDVLCNVFRRTGSEFRDLTRVSRLSPVIRVGGHIGYSSSDVTTSKSVRKNWPQRGGQFVWKATIDIGYHEKYYFSKMS